MANTVYTKTYAAPPFDRGEILRYLGVRAGTPEIDVVVNECIEQVQSEVSYKVCFCEVDVSCADEVLTIGNLKTESKALKKNLLGCERAIVFAATVGISIDRLTMRYGAISPTKALIFDAIGSERIEALCDIFNAQIREKMLECGCNTRPRFSPGYGDFPIEFQRDIFVLLDCQRKIGLTLNESMLMSPSKSVTAIIGISQT